MSPALFNMSFSSVSIDFIALYSSARTLDRRIKNLLLTALKDAKKNVRKTFILAAYPYKISSRLMLGNRCIL